jgi:prepilin-type N-terminal cleavage/methylation domain-containing protein
VAKKGFTLIELVMTIAIIGVLAGAGSWLMLNTVRNSVFIPNQMNMDKLVNDALNIMIDGDNQAKGLRFSRQITGTSVNQVDFVNQDSQSIRYRLDTAGNKLYRKIGAAAETALPYYSSAAGITMNGKSNTLFTYYDSAGAVTSVAANVRRIRMILIAKTGTGLYNDWEGQSELASSVAVKKFQ